MKRIVTLTLLLLFAIGFSACKKEKEIEKYAEDTPPAIKELVKQYEESGVNISSVTEYAYGEQIIYFFEEWKGTPNCRHLYYGYIHDKEGNLLCSARWTQYNSCRMEYKDYEKTRRIYNVYGINLIIGGQK